MLPIRLLELLANTSPSKFRMTGLAPDSLIALIKSALLDSFVLLSI